MALACWPRPSNPRIWALSSAFPPELAASCANGAAGRPPLRRRGRIARARGPGPRARTVTGVCCLASSAAAVGGCAAAPRAAAAAAHEWAPQCRQPLLRCPRGVLSLKYSLAAAPGRPRPRTGRLPSPSPASLFGATPARHVSRRPWQAALATPFTP